MVGDLAGGGEIAVKLARVHKQHVAGVGKTLAASTVGLEIVPQAKVDARQVADCGVVLGMREPPQRCASGITGVGLNGRPQAGYQPGQQRLTIGGRQLAGLPRRHPPGLDLFPYRLPDSKVTGQVGGCEEPVEGHGRLRIVAGVAVKAGIADDRERLSGICRRAGDSNRRQADRQPETEGEGGRRVSGHGPEVR